MLFFIVLVGSILTVTVATNQSSIVNSVSRLELAVARMSLKLDSTERELKAVKAKQKSTREELQSTKQILQSNISLLNALEEKNNQNNLCQMRRAVYFQVRQTNNKVQVFHKEVLKFDDVTLNAGNAYNPRSGIFITPLTGTYIFWANVYAEHKGGSFKVNLMRGGKVLAKGYHTFELTYGVAIINFMTEIEKGEHVWFEYEFTGVEARVHSYYSYYGGTLIYT